MFINILLKLIIKAEIEKSDADLKVEDLTAYITVLEKQMQIVTKHSENWVKRYRETALTLSELGQSLTNLGETETDTLHELLITVR